MKLGRAVQLAAETGNDEATTRLRKVVDIDDEAPGPCASSGTVDKPDEMALDTASTKTTRVAKVTMSTSPAPTGTRRPRPTTATSAVPIPARHGASAAPAAPRRSGHRRPAAPPAAAGGADPPRPCPNWLAERAAALFCEDCGYDFTTGHDAAPPARRRDRRSSRPAGTARRRSRWPRHRRRLGGRGLGRPRLVRGPGERGPVPVPRPAGGRPLAAKSVLVGRPSASRNIHPEIDCDGRPGVSRRQAQLTTDGHRWWVEDLQSSNGTYVGPASGPCPTDPVPPGQRRELSEDDRVYVGAWTRLVQPSQSSRRRRCRRRGTPSAPARTVDTDPLLPRCLVLRTKPCERRRRVITGRRPRLHVGVAALGRGRTHLSAPVCRHGCQSRKVVRGHEAVH